MWKPKLGSRGSNHALARDSLENVCSLTALRNLSISGDREYLPPKISSLVNLRYLSVFFVNLTSLLPELNTSSGPTLTRLQHLSLYNCMALSALPSWIDSLSQLVSLHLCFCRRLTSLPNLHKLQELQKLELSFCTGLRQLPPGFTSNTAFLALKELYMENCDGLQEFPFIEKGAFPRLTVLELTRCAFQTLPRSLSFLPGLVKLKVNLCKRLKNLDDCFRLRADRSSDPSSSPQLHHRMLFFKNLRELELKGLPLNNLPCHVADCPSLKMVDLRDTQVAIPENLRGLPADGKICILRSSV